MGCGGIRAVENEIIEDLDDLQNKMTEMEDFHKQFNVQKQRDKNSDDCKKLEKRLHRLNDEVMEYILGISNKLLICEEQARKNNHPKLTNLKRKYYEIYKKYR